MRRKQRRQVALLPIEEVIPDKKPIVVHSTGVDDAILNDLSTAFELLYDPDNYFHLPEEEQLKKFEQRDLYDAKCWKAAIKYFGDKRTIREMLGPSKGRKRIVYADSKHYEPTPLVNHHLPEGISFLSKDDTTTTTTTTTTRIQIEKSSSTQSTKLSEIQNYQQNYSQLRSLRQNIQELGNLEKWLAGKPDKSVAERQLQRTMQNEKRQSLHKDEIQKKSKSVEVEQPKKSLVLIRPSPIAVKIIYEELQKRRLRLLDLFTAIDKKKNWLINRNDFVKAFQDNDIQIPASLLEDLINTLDRDNNNELDYKELARGLHDYRRQRRSSVGKLPGDEEDERPMSSSCASTVSSKSTNLSVPEIDLRPDEYKHNSPEEAVEQRKHDKTVLPKVLKNRRKPAAKNETDPSKLLLLPPYKSHIRTGNDLIDGHCAPTTLVGDIGEHFHTFREKSMHVYNEIFKICEKKNIVFNEDFLNHVLLFPGDVQTAAIQQNLRFPEQMLSRDEAHKRLQNLITKQSIGGSTYAQSLLQHFNANYANTSSRLPGEQSIPTYLPKLSRRPGGGGGGGGMDDEDNYGFTHHHNNNHKQIRFPNLQKAAPFLPRASELRAMHEDWQEPIHLSTGWATVNAKVDCWMTFEQFLQITKNLKRKFPHSNYSTKSNSFWPGEILDRVRLVMDNESPFQKHITTHFQCIRSY